MQLSAESDTQGIEPAPLLAALLIQAGAGAAVYAALSLYSGGGMAGLWPWLAGLLAALAGRLGGLPWWWLPINFLLPAAASFLLNSALPASVYLAAFLVLWLSNTGAWRGRVPLVLSRRAAIASLLTLLPKRADFSVLDVGCGSGSVLMRLAHARPEGHYHGIELAPLPYLVSRCRALFAAGSLDIRLGDFWDVDLSRYDVVYAYLSPAVMPALWSKARREMRPGTLFVSNSFEVPGVAPLRTIRYAARGKLYVWRMHDHG